MKLLLCFDGGSSSLKFAGYRLGESCEQLVRTISTNAPSNNDAEAGLDEVLYQLRPQSEGDVAAVGHRLVFGGPQYVAPVLADDEVLADLENLVALEPLHLRAELDLVYAARRRLPNATHVLCFDTAFHRRSPAIAKRLPLPRDVDPLLERYGFHGLSYRVHRLATRCERGTRGDRSSRVGGEPVRDPRWHAGRHDDGLQRSLAGL